MSPDRASTRDRLILGLACCAAFMSSLDVNSLRMALPALSEVFHADSSTISWVQLIYLLVLTSFIMVFGRLGDMLGYRRLFLLGFLTYVAGASICAFSEIVTRWLIEFTGIFGKAEHVARNKIYILLAGRAVQGLGGAAMTALTTPILSSFLPDSQRMGAIGIAATFESLGITLGRFLGGVIIEYLDWHWLFLIDIPVGLGAFAIGFFVLPKEHEPQADNRFDYFGATLQFGMLSFFLFALSLGQELGWNSPAILGSFAVAFVMFCTFLWWEHRIHYAILDLSIFRSLNLSLALITSFIKYFVESGVYYLLPFFMVLVLKMSPSVAGGLLVIPSFLQMLITPTTSRLMKSLGSRWLTSLSMLALTWSCVMCRLLDSTSSMTAVVFAISTIGISKALFIAPNRHRIMTYSPPDKMGSVNGALETTVRFAVTMGICGFESVFSEYLPTKGADYVNAPLDELMTGFDAAYMMGIIACAAGFVAGTISFPEGKKRE